MNCIRKRFFDSPLISRKPSNPAARAGWLGTPPYFLINHGEQAILCLYSAPPLLSHCTAIENSFQGCSASDSAFWSGGRCIRAISRPFPAALRFVCGLQARHNRLHSRRSRLLLCCFAALPFTRLRLFGVFTRGFLDPLLSCTALGHSLSTRDHGGFQCGNCSRL
jgi:hypothetical protein